MLILIHYLRWESGLTSFTTTVYYNPKKEFWFMYLYNFVFKRRVRDKTRIYKIRSGRTYALSGS